ncbi:hypothetical protein KC19_3G201300 [Ceratodon purpureus]|uniref:Non-structural maintenance of chromosomes element 4 n=1 Tax=Ceratodon purpureus TaxID=3225 RepID=A0A8T0IMV0_CERPU|nr:hypothetical protein KC19_3G201300 [Ceratodon purpureus]
MNSRPRSVRRRRAEGEGGGGSASQEDDNAERRRLRAEYRELQHSIHVDKEAIGSADTTKFMDIVSKMDELHHKVRKPREQIADAEAVLGVTRHFVECMKDARRKGGVSPATFVGHIIRGFSVPTTDRNDDAPYVIDWGKLGIAGCGIFNFAPGLSTMLGPMDIEPKSRKSGVRRSRVRPTQFTQAEEVKDRSQEESNAQTDANMETMFRKLRAVKQARLDVLVLNRRSFSQTVENIFSLSFLVKDGRVSITYDEDGEHIVGNAFLNLERDDCLISNNYLVQDMERVQVLFNFLLFKHTVIRKCCLSKYCNIFVMT